MTTVKLPFLSSLTIIDLPYNHTFKIHNMAFTSDNDTVTSTASSAGSSEIVKLIRSNVIGSRSIISTPFGKREIVYADYTASGRCLKFIEDYMMKVVAPSYANTHTEASATGAQTTHLREEARNLIRKAVNAPSDEYAVLFTGYVLP